MAMRNEELVIDQPPIIPLEGDSGANGMTVRLGDDGKID